MGQRIVILANSWMDGGRCVAGKILSSGGNPGDWIRLVTGETGGCLSESHVSGIDLLDVVDVPILGPANQYGGHKENQAVDASNLRKMRRFPGNISSLMDNPETLWANTSSSKTGEHNRISKSEFKDSENSLALIKPDILLRLYRAYNKMRAAFHYRGVSYNLSITDPKCPSPQESLKAYLCVSVTGTPDPNTDYHYKLVAGIITP